MTESSHAPRAFPAGFLAWLAHNELDVRIYEHGWTLPRTLRLHPQPAHPMDQGILQHQLDGHCEQQEEKDQVSRQLKPTETPGVFFLDGRVPIAQLPAYRQGLVYGIDYASVLAVLAMDLEPQHHVLDLCCAPGAKLMFIADLINKCGTVTGVDVSTERLNTCRSLARKYKQFNIRLFEEDGTNFSRPPPAPDEFLPSHLHPTCQKQDRNQKSRRKREATRAFLQQQQRQSSAEVSVAPAPTHYDRVLVDAECTHDGSIRHILKFDVWGWETFERRFLDPQRLGTLQTLQRQLLLNGFDLLRPGGTLVYSTCSFCREQNEDIVSWFLEQQAETAELIPLPSAGDASAKDPQNFVRALISAPPVESKILPGTLKFDPLHSGTSGLFVAKIRKKEQI